MTLYLLVNQNFALIFALLVIYYSFLAINNCGKDTMTKVRISLILAFCSGSGVAIYLLMGNVPHWSFTMLLAAGALKLASERRKERRSKPRTEPYTGDRNPRHP